MRLSPCSRTGPAVLRAAIENPDLAPPANGELLALWRAAVPGGLSHWAPRSEGRVKCDMAELLKVIVFQEHPLSSRSPERLQGHSTPGPSGPGGA